MKLDPKALEAAAYALQTKYHGDARDEPFGLMAKWAITAYLTAIGETHVIVPREPTDDMLKAAVAAIVDFDARKCWNSMLAAAKEGE